MSTKTTPFQQGRREDFFAEYGSTVRVAATLDSSSQQPVLGREPESTTWPNGVPRISDEQRAANLASPGALRDLIAALSLYIGRYEETQLTTEQKELLADVIENGDEASAAAYGR